MSNGETQKVLGIESWLEEVCNQAREESRLALTFWCVMLFIPMIIYAAGRIGDIYWAELELRRNKKKEEPND